MYQMGYTWEDVLVRKRKHDKRLRALFRGYKHQNRSRKMPMGRIQFDGNPTTGSIELIGPSSKRQSLRLYAPQTGGVTISNDPIVVFGQGIVLLPGMTRVKFTRHNDGELVGRTWHVMYLAGSTGISYVEIME